MIFHRRHRDLDARVEAAEKERHHSRDRLERIRREVVRPLQEAGEHNQFAEMIRQSLLEGHDR